MERFSHQSQPAQSRPPQTGAPTTAPVSNSKKVKKPSFASKLLVVVLMVAGLLVVSALAVGIWRSVNNTGLIKTGQYQAVFLDNGQVYFGKLDRLNNPYVELTDIYYLQVDQQVQPDQSDQDAPQQQISLAKLGNELHGPEDKMFINPGKIVFWENLKTDGQVTQAIIEFQNTETE